MCCTRNPGPTDQPSPWLPAALQWERVKKAGMAPGSRTSFGMVTHRKRAVLFGGVMDREGQVGGAHV